MNEFLWRLQELNNIVRSCAIWITKKWQIEYPKSDFSFWKCRTNWQEFSSPFIFLKDSFLHFQSSTVKIWKIIKCEVQKCRNDMHYTIWCVMLCTLHYSNRNSEINSWWYFPFLCQAQTPKLWGVLYCSPAILFSPFPFLT